MPLPLPTREDQARKRIPSREELRRLLEPRICGCGTPAKALFTLLALLDWMHAREASGCGYSFNPPFAPPRPPDVGDDGAKLLLFYMLESWDLTEHGGSGWLTVEGHRWRLALRREADHDGFDELVGGL